MRIAVISPHLDDAVFSVGERMLQQAEKGNDIVTVCPIAGVPHEEPHRSKYLTLLKEHDEVCVAMGWQNILGPFFDDAVPQERRLPGVMREWLLGVIRECRPDRVWSPCGIHHPDHLWVAREMPLIAGVVWCVYDELPYHSLYPEIQTQHGAFVPYTRDPKVTLRKRWACNMYASQMNSPDLEKHLYLPERLWEA